MSCHPTSGPLMPAYCFMPVCHPFVSRHFWPYLHIPSVPRLSSWCKCFLWVTSFLHLYFLCLYMFCFCFFCYIHATAHLPLTPPSAPVPTLLHQQCANVNKIHNRLISHQWKHEHFIQSRICFTPRVDLLYVRGDISIHISRSAHVWYSSLLAL